MHAVYALPPEFFLTYIELCHLALRKHFPVPFSHGGVDFPLFLLGREISVKQCGYLGLGFVLSNRL